MRFPDFFLVGAPKCGTTAIYSYLQTNPSVFMPQIKEPHYYSSDMPGLSMCNSEKQYLAMFAEAPERSVLGEASATYLFSDTAIEKIMQNNARARMIAMLRNPIEMAHAYHAERMYNLNEDVADFQCAWNLQEKRRRGYCIPRHCREPKLLQYREVCSYARQITRFFNIVPESQRAVFIFEEFREKPKSTYLAILEFLGLPDDGRSEFPRVNANKALRSRRLAEWHRLVRAHMGRWYRPLHIAANAIGLHPSRILRRWNVVSQPRTPLGAEFRHQLACELAPDVRETERLLGRRLACWRDFRTNDNADAAETA